MSAIPSSRSVAGPPEAVIPGSALLIVSVGIPDVGAAELSAAHGPVLQLDVDVEADDAIGLRLRRFEGGAEAGLPADARSPAVPELAVLAAYALLGRPDPARRTTVVAIAPERAPDLVHILLGVLNADYVVLAASAAYNQTILRMLNSAREVRLLPEPGLAEDWRTTQPFPAADGSLPVPAGVLDSLGPADDEPVRWTSPDHLHVLLVSYFAAPSTPVSTQRLGHWHRGLVAAGDRVGVGLETLWLSATGAATGAPGQVVVRDAGDHLLDAGTRERIRQAAAAGVPTIGMAWARHVRRALPRFETPPDVVVLSVGPFGCLDLVDVVAEAWGCPVVLDFRDPYARDPRLTYRPTAVAWMEQHEHAAVERAAAVVSVNAHCLAIIAPEVDARRVVASNGYDEGAIERASDGHAPRPTRYPIRIAYAGTIYRQWPLDTVLDALPAARFRLVHLGRDQSSPPVVAGHAAARAVGHVDADTMLRTLLDCDAGLVRLGAELTVETTKVFDYLGCDLDVLIVSDGEPWTGALADLLRGEERVHWLPNDPEELQRFFATYEPARARRPDRERYSRGFQAETLARLLGELAGRAPGGQDHPSQDHPSQDHQPRSTESGS